MRDGRRPSRTFGALGRQHTQGAKGVVTPKSALQQAAF